ncbi:hypothetical protein FJ465_24750, partial [Salmonella enterica subsp. enterica serovar Kentucky]|nr:hypothetical protein [Salmonella enterica subsp. enterica serovar Kentucky]ECT3165100.1 hypothetical protein [Salmonella enterica subsp. enterica serovar Kentucky]
EMVCYLCIESGFSTDLLPHSISIAVILRARFYHKFVDRFLHQASFVTEYWCYDRYRSVRPVVCFFFWRLIQSHKLD